MNIEDNLKGLRQSMTRTSLKGIEPDEQKLKRYVTERKKKRFSLRESSKRMTQFSASVIGIATLCMLMIYLGMGGFDEFKPLDPGEKSLPEPFVSDQEGQYQVVIVQGDPSDSKDRDFTNVLEEPLYKDIIKEKVYKLDKESTRGKSLLDRYKYINKDDPTDFPSVFVFNTEQLVFHTNQVDNLDSFMQLLVGESTEEVDQGEFEIAGLTLGDPFQKALEKLGKADTVFPYPPKEKGDIESSVLFREEGRFATSVLLDSHNQIIGFTFFVSQLKTEKWRNRVPTTKEDIRSSFGKPNKISNFYCGDNKSCKLYHYGDLLVKFNQGEKSVALIEYRTPKVQKLEMSKYLSDTKGKYFVTTLLEHDENKKERERWDEALPSFTEGILSGAKMHIGSLSGFDYKLRAKYNLQKTPVALVMDTEGLVLKTHDPQQLKEFFEQKK